MVNFGPKTTSRGGRTFHPIFTDWYNFIKFLWCISAGCENVIEQGKQFRQVHKSNWMKMDMQIPRSGRHESASQRHQRPVWHCRPIKDDTSGQSQKKKNEKPSDGPVDAENIDTIGRSRRPHGTSTDACDASRTAAVYSNSTKEGHFFSI